VLDKFGEYGNRFAEKARSAGINETGVSIGAVTAGIMAELLSCPECQEMRIPNNENWDVLYCRKCDVFYKHEKAGT